MVFLTLQLPNGGRVAFLYFSVQIGLKSAKNVIFSIFCMPVGSDPNEEPPELQLLKTSNAKKIVFPQDLK